MDILGMQNPVSLDGLSKEDLKKIINKYQERTSPFYPDIVGDSLEKKKTGGKVKYRSIGGKVGGNDVIKMIYD